MTYLEYLRVVRLEQLTNPRNGLCVSNADVQRGLCRSLDTPALREPILRHCDRLSTAIKTELGRLEHQTGGVHVYLHPYWNKQRPNDRLTPSEAQTRRLELLDAWISIETCMDPLAPLRADHKAGRKVWGYDGKTWTEAGSFDLCHPLDCTTVSPFTQAVQPPDPHANLKLAHKNGAEIEYWQEALGEWRAAKDPLWNPETLYRTKPEITLQELKDAWASGLDIEISYRRAQRYWYFENTPSWDFSKYQYRIKPGSTHRFQHEKAAFRAGSAIQYWDSHDCRWCNTLYPTWEAGQRFRVKPENVEVRLLWWRSQGGKGPRHVSMVTAEDQASDPRDEWQGFEGWASGWITCDPSDIKG